MIRLVFFSALAMMAASDAADLSAATYAGKRVFGDAVVNLRITTDGTLGWIGQENLTEVQLNGKIGSNVVAIKSGIGGRGSSFETLSFAGHGLYNSLYATATNLFFDFTSGSQSYLFVDASSPFSFAY